MTIEPGRTVLLDVATPPLDCLEVQGSLVADPLLDVGITANCIEVMDGGTLQIGTDAHPHAKTATITLTGPRGVHTPRTEDNALDNDGQQRGLRVMDGGALRLFGETAPLLKTKLAAHALAGATTLITADDLGWHAGDRIAVSLTDFYGVGETEILTLAADSAGKTLQTMTGLQTFRWGLLQYPVDFPVNGNVISLTPGTFTPASASTATVLDERAEVVNLTRRIVIQGADDADWRNQGFGVHVMVMGLRSAAQVRGVEFRRCGQRRAMGRYPFHWHMISYTAADASGNGGGTYLGDVSSADQFIQDCAICESQNRAVTIHGTCGALVKNVYAVDVKGHAFFMEDGSERRNTITGCVAMKVRDPGATDRLKLHDADASGFWLTNPDNTIKGNSGSDCSGRGLWNSFAATKCHGLSRNCAVSPVSLLVLVHEDNVGHSNALTGLATTLPVIDEAGTTEPDNYEPGLGIQFFLRRNQVWKNREGGYLNHVGAAQYIDWVAADNMGFDFSGRSFRASLEGTLLVGFSRNNATPFTHSVTGSVRVASASYHFLLTIKNITALNYPLQAPIHVGSNTLGGGVFGGMDLYTDPVMMWHTYNTGWRLINSHPGYLTAAPYFDGYTLAMGWTPERYRYWSMAGAIWDPHGYWGTAGNYLIPNNTFYNYSVSSSVGVSYGNNFLSTPDVFMGIRPLTVNGNDSAVAWRCGRLDASNAEVAEHTLGDPALSAFLPGMRHFTFAPGGRYKLTLPGGQMPTTGLSMSMTNAWRSTDWVLIGLPWSGSVDVAGHIDSGRDGNDEATKIAQGRRRLLSFTGTSISGVLNDSTGATAWQDKANNTAWVKHQGGLTIDATDTDFLWVHYIDLFSK